MKRGTKCKYFSKEEGKLFCDNYLGEGKESCTQNCKKVKKMNTEPKDKFELVVD